MSGGKVWLCEDTANRHAATANMYVFMRAIVGENLSVTEEKENGS